MKARRSGKRLYTGRLGTPKSVHIEIYAQLNVEYQGLTFDDGTIIILIPTVQLRTRKAAEDDNALRLFLASSPIILITIRRGSPSSRLAVARMVRSAMKGLAAGRISPRAIVR